MKYSKNYCEENGISTSELNESQRTLYYIAENMKMDKSISEEGYRHFQMAIKALEQTRWIPVSERLPDDSTVVFYTDNKGETGMICYWEDLPREFEDIIAWMPLPDPHKEGEADDE